MYWNKKDQDFRNKIFANAIANKSPYFRRNLCINHKSTTVRIVRIKSKRELVEKVAGLSYLDPQICYQFANVKILSTVLFNSKVDLVFTGYDGKALIINKEINKDSVVFRPEKAKFA
ncbi:hypothetical protein FACS1894166_08820 [Bacilli bacterium]|nr:hypothetical protein FACS1894166_08820 [Bacilli bacterium]